MKPSRALNEPLLYAKPWRVALHPLLHQRGIDHNALFRELPPYRDDLKTADYRLSHLQMQHLLAQVESHLNDQQIWQLLAETFCQTAMSPLVDLCLQAPSLQRAMELGYHYRDLAMPNTLVLPQQSNNALSISLLPYAGTRTKVSRAARHASIKLSVALLITLARLRGCDIRHWQLQLPDGIRPLPTWQKWIAKVSVREIPRLVIPTDSLTTSRPVDKGRLNQARYFCRVQQTTLGAPAQFERVFRCLLQQVNRGEECSLSGLSAQLGLSVSSCKRLFAAFGQSYQDCYDQVRLYKLLDLLQQPGGTNSELASQLGYSNPNNFRRACKRWLGLAPDQLRQRSPG